ncbi:hypothetical protein [Fontibacillus sp. BL9]|uniref:hypothetical protein n=1 Tax=Fontibacillus sp. BL9 TaxID=3389971 RepID=UPI00397D7283
MTKSENIGSILNLAGMLLICAAILLRRGDYHVNDFLMGLMNGAGIGFILLGLFQLGRKRSKA